MRSALIVWGGWSGHDPEECAAIYRRWLHEDGYSVRVETDPEVFADPSIHDLSLIIPCTTMSKIERPAAENLAKAIESGVGMAGHHGTMGDAFHDSPVYQFITGGQWVAHPGNIIDYTVDVVKPDDPIMQGIKSFPYTSEQYYMHVDPGNEVLATTTFTGDHAPWINGRRDAGRLEEDVRPGPRLLLVARSPRDRVREPQHGDDPPPRHQLGGARGGIAPTLIAARM